MKILLLEDDKLLNKAIKEYLTIKGFNITSYFDGEDALNNIGGYDLYLLDINTPTINGIDILKTINENSIHSKVIILSANINIEIIKEAYDYGCYDYLKKPFEIEELYFKINKIAKDHKNILQLNNELKFDTYNSILYSNDKTVALTKKELDFLKLLLKFKDQVVTYNQIEFDVYDNQSTSLVTIRTLVKRLRQKVGKDNIKTVINVGYSSSFIQI